MTTPQDQHTRSSYPAVANNTHTDVVPT